MTPEVYQPTSIGSTIVALIFYIVMGGFALYSLFAIYALIRFGRSRTLAVVITVTYIIISSSLFTAAVVSLNKIR